MKATAAKLEWTDFLKLYSQKNDGRPTRLGTFENDNGTIIDYWIEDGLPLVGIDIDPGQDMPIVEIMVGGLTHTVKDATKVSFHFTNNGTEDGIDIVDATGKTTILRFENT